MGIENGTEAAKAVVVELRRISALMDVRLGAHHRLRPISRAGKFTVKDGRFSCWALSSLLVKAIPMSGTAQKRDYFVSWAVLALATDNNQHTPELCSTSTRKTCSDYQL